MGARRDTQHLSGATHLPHAQLCSWYGHPTSTAIPNPQPCQTHLHFGQGPPASTTAGLDPDLLALPNPKCTAMLGPYLLPPLRINPELFQNVLLESQTPCVSRHQKMPLIARQRSKMQWPSETGRSGGGGSASAEGEILVLAGFQQQCSQAFVLSTS